MSRNMQETTYQIICITRFSFTCTHVHLFTHLALPAWSPSQLKRHNQDKSEPKNTSYKPHSSRTLAKVLAQYKSSITQNTTSWKALTSDNITSFIIPFHSRTRTWNLYIVQNVLQDALQERMKRKTATTTKKKIMQYMSMCFMSFFFLQGVNPKSKKKGSRGMLHTAVMQWLFKMSWVQISALPYYPLSLNSLVALDESVNQMRQIYAVMQKKKKKHNSVFQFTLCLHMVMLM